MGGRYEETIDLASSQSQDSETDDDTQKLVAQPSRHAMHPHAAAAGPSGSKVAAPPRKMMVGASACALPQSAPHARAMHAAKPAWIRW